MSRDPISELIDGLLKLGALQFRICSMISEAVLAPRTASAEAAAAVPLRTFSEEEVEAAALAIERQLLGNYELGFQAMLRLNFPRHRLREIARAALTAAEQRRAALTL
jgi:hypothetical protein